MRKKTLYGPRIAGDIAPGTEPSRLAGDDAASWARQDFPGQRIAGQADQNIYDASATQKFDIGTRRIEYGRTFRYSCAGANLTWTGLQRLLSNGNYTPEDPAHEDQYGFYGDLLTAAVIGDKYIDLETSTAYAANFFKGAYVAIWPDSNRPVHYIVKSDLGTGTYCRCYLDHPLRVNISATNGVEVYRSPYSRIIEPTADSGWLPFVGVAYCGAVTSGYYFWMQTRGPCWLTPTDWDTTTPGIAASDREVYAWIDGTIKGGAGITIETGYQRIGYLLSATASGYGDVFVMLQLE